MTDTSSLGGFVAIAIHHAAPEHEEAFIAFMHDVVAATEGAPGLLAFEACRHPDGTVRLVAGALGVSTWESAEAFQAGLERIGSLSHLRRPEWSAKPDEVITLVPLQRPELDSNQRPTP